MFHNLLQMHGARAVMHFNPIIMERLCVASAVPSNFFSGWFCLERLTLANGDHRYKGVWIF